MIQSRFRAGERLILQRAGDSGKCDQIYIMSSDGTGQHLVFGSNRKGKVPHETNIFIADWKE